MPPPRKTKVVDMQKQTQLFFYDDHTFGFKKRPLKYSCFIETSGDKIIRAWPHSYRGLYSFRGYKNISAGMILLGFNRDIFLDPHNKIPESVEISGKPKRNDIEIKKWIARVAENQRHIFRAKRKTSQTANYINIALIVIAIALAVGWLIRFATGG